MKKLLHCLIVSLSIVLLFGCIRKQPQITEEAAKVAPAPEATEAAEKTFTLEELAKYDGREGRPAYLAVDGMVYDLSSVFYEGEHYEHIAGKSLTKEFYSQHTKEALKDYPIVGRLAE